MTATGDERQPGLSRAGLVTAALGLIQEEGLEGLSMRALAEQLDVKAASLYWHVRDRRELLEMLADSILGEVPATRGGSQWRPAVLRLCAALALVVARQRDADRVLLEVPEALERSDTYARLKQLLGVGGLSLREAAEVARLLMIQVITAHTNSVDGPELEPGRPASIAIDSGSRGVVLRRGADMDTLIRVPHDPTTAAPAVVRGERVVVRRLRGVGDAAIELNPRHPWRFQVQGPTWKTVLDVGGIDVREIKLDSGATKVECFLPPPRGIVPIQVSGGVVGVKLHRRRDTAVTADVSAGAVRVRLEALSVKATITDLQWETEGGRSHPDRYELRISGGAVQVSLDADVPDDPAAPAGIEATEKESGQTASALEILLDGVESRARSRAATS